jgi:hypothetical protein
MTAYAEDAIISAMEKVHKEKESIAVGLTTLKQIIDSPYYELLKDIIIPALRQGVN